MSTKHDLEKYGELQEVSGEISLQIAKLKTQMEQIESEMAEIEMRLTDDMRGSGKKKATMWGWRLNLSTSYSTIVEDEAAIPEEYMKVYTKPDLLKIREMLKAGEYVPGTARKKNENLSIRKV